MRGYMQHLTTGVMILNLSEIMRFLFFKNFLLYEYLFPTYTSLTTSTTPAILHNYTRSYIEFYIGFEWKIEQEPEMKIEIGLKIRQIDINFLLIIITLVEVLHNPYKQIE